MHIAVCDDNVADRKQLERLLKRESDKRAQSTGVIYTSSFGNASTMLANPMQYNAFYIDVCKTEGITGMDIVRDLTTKGVNAPIVMCCSDVNYREYSFPSNVIFLDKPIKVTELSESIDHALSIMEQAEPLIELREDTETFYVTEPDILYAVETDRHVLVTIKDGRKLNVIGSSLNLYEQVAHYPTFIAPSQKTMLNARYIKRLIFHKATMVDGATFHIHRDCIKYTKKIMEEMYSASQSLINSN